MLYMCRTGVQERGWTLRNGDKMEKDEKKKRPKKSRHTVRTILRILQHISLGAMALAMLVVVSGSTVWVEGFRGDMDFNMYSQDRNSPYEESGMFNSIFGYAVADIIRYGVVSSQLETDGYFDGNKMIDVTAYNYRDIGLPEQYVTAEYSLEDLLKWANYGFEWTSVQMTPEQAEKFLSDKTRVVVIDPESKYYNTSDASYLKSDIGAYTFVNDVSANQLWVDTDDYDGFVDGYQNSDSDSEVLVEVFEEGTGQPEDGGTEPDADSSGQEEVKSYDVLVNRYKTAEGKNLEEYVSDWDIYYDLCHNVRRAADSLVYNYNEYVDYGEYYSPQKSNVEYLIMKTVGDNMQIYSNLEDEQKLYGVTEFMVLEEGAESSLIHDAGKYIYYSPADMVYLTNTTIAEETVRGILNSYDYAYPETVKIWMNVDTSYPIHDVFWQGAEGFENVMPHFWQWVGIALFSCVLYLVLLFYLTGVAGREIDENGNPYIQLQPFDKIHTEAALLIACGAIVLAIWVLIVLMELANFNSVDLSAASGGMLHERWFRILLAAGMFLADSVAMYFFYSLVRRIKARTLWKDSYTCKAARRAKKFVWRAYDNSHIILRVLVPYMLFLLFNFIMVFVAFVGDGFGTVLALAFLVAFDILVGNLLYRNAKEQQEIIQGIETIAGGQLEHQVETSNLHGDNLTLAHSVNSIGKGIKEAVEISMKDERMKADLITNVSHDIKTPLTSIINYVDLIKREQVDNEKVQNYIQVLDEKSQRLKQLTDDLVEASKISSGNISLHFEKINLTELMNQTIGEFSEKFEQKGLTTVMNVHAQNAFIEADSRRIWRVIENLFNNIYKYAMEGTRVYVTVGRASGDGESVEVSIKNISESPLNCNPDELTERFIRGDESRTTEGSGLGLSIAKNLTLAQGGTFEIQLDGDLFKVILTFPLAQV